MNLYVVRSPERKYHSSILDLSKSINLTLIESPGIFLESLESIRVDKQSAFLRLGRDIEKSEVGVSLAHRKVYEDIIQNNERWAMVFEDDVIIENLCLMEMQIKQIFLHANDMPCIFLFFHHLQTGLREESMSGFTKSSYVPSYAVAYALNLSAAKILFDSQRIIKSIADWPVCTHDVDFYLANSIAVKHGSESHYFPSNVGPPIRRQGKTGKRILWFFGFYNLKFQKTSLRDIHRHLCFVILPRFFGLFSRDKTLN